MSARKGFAELFAELENDPEYWLEHAVLDFTEELCRIMEEQNITRAELARRMGASPAYITKVLRAEGNFTLSTLVRFANAVDYRIALHMAPKASITRWIDELGFPEHASIAANVADVSPEESPGVYLNTWPAAYPGLTFGLSPSAAHAGLSFDLSYGVVAKGGQADSEVAQRGLARDVLDAA